MFLVYLNLSSLIQPQVTNLQLSACCQEFLLWALCNAIAMIIMVNQPWKFIFPLWKKHSSLQISGLSWPLRYLDKNLCNLLMRISFSHLWLNSEEGSRQCMHAYVRLRACVVGWEFLQTSSTHRCSCDVNHRTLSLGSQFKNKQKTSSWQMSIKICAW